MSITVMEYAQEMKQSTDFATIDHPEIFGLRNKSNLDLQLVKGTAPAAGEGKPNACPIDQYLQY